MREKSDSITHLVKIVAREVAEEVLIESGTPLAEVGRDMCENIVSSLEEAGRPWPKEENDLLLQEIKCAIAQIAKNHSRSPNAVRERLIAQIALNKLHY